MMIVQLLLGLAAVVQPAPEAGKDARPADQGPAGQASIAQLCKARQFETIVTYRLQGKMRRTRIRLCGEEGQSDSEWVVTLRDAASKLAASRAYPDSAKAQALQAIDAEIAKYEPPAPMAKQRLDSSTAAPSSLNLPKPALSLPTAPAEALPSSGYSILPPLDVKPAEPARTSAAVNSARAPTVTISCAQAHRPERPLPCSWVERDTVIAVRADEPLRAGRIRFVRKGATRAELRLGQMRAGDIRSVKLPAAVCAGVLRSTLEIEVSDQQSLAAAATRGPFTLRC
jgi:hypothetical protein